MGGIFTFVVGYTEMNFRLLKPKVCRYNQRTKIPGSIVAKVPLYALSLRAGTKLPPI